MLKPHCLTITNTFYFKIFRASLPHTSTDFLGVCAHMCMHLSVCAFVYAHSCLFNLLVASKKILCLKLLLAVSTNRHMRSYICAYVQYSVGDLFIFSIWQFVIIQLMNHWRKFHNLSYLPVLHYLRWDLWTKCCI